MHRAMIAGFPLTFWLRMARGWKPWPLRQSAVIAVSMVQRAGFEGFRAGEKVPCCFFIGIDATGWSRRFFGLAARGGHCLFSSRKAWPPARLD